MPRGEQVVERRERLARPGGGVPSRAPVSRPAAGGRRCGRRPGAGRSSRGSRAGPRRRGRRRPRQVGGRGGGRRGGTARATGVGDAAVSDAVAGSGRRRPVRAGRRPPGPRASRSAAGVGRRPPGAGVAAGRPAPGRLVDQAVGVDQQRPDPVGVAHLHGHGLPDGPGQLGDAGRDRGARLGEVRHADALDDAVDRDLAGAVLAHLGADVGQSGRRRRRVLPVGAVTHVAHGRCPSLPVVRPRNYAARALACIVEPQASAVRMPTSGSP